MGVGQLGVGRKLETEFWFRCRLIEAQSRFVKRSLFIYVLLRFFLRTFKYLCDKNFMSGGAKGRVDWLIKKLGRSNSRAAPLQPLLLRSVSSPQAGPQVSFSIPSAFVLVFLFLSLSRSFFSFAFICIGQ